MTGQACVTLSTVLSTLLTKSYKHTYTSPNATHALASRTVCPWVSPVRNRHIRSGGPKTSSPPAGPCNRPYRAPGPVQRQEKCKKSRLTVEEMGENGTPPGRLHLEVEHEKWFWNMKGQLWVDIIQTMNANEVDHPVRSFGIYMPAAPIGVPTHRRPYPSA